MQSVEGWRVANKSNIHCWLSRQVFSSYLISPRCWVISNLVELAENPSLTKFDLGESHSKSSSVTETFIKNY